MTALAVVPEILEALVPPDESHPDRQKKMIISDQREQFNDMVDPKSNEE
tara:strand:+ start:743 stop:889 length:147 start_codon:yes stop_codon:yes gene_type:complete